VSERERDEALEPELSDRDRMILDHLPLLHHIVGRMAVDLPRRVERDDLMGFGMLGLIAAADSWDASRGLKFSTYAYTRIRGAVLDELRKLDFLPRGRREQVRALEQSLRRLEQANGSPPSPEELAADLGIGMDEVDEILVSAKLAGLVSLDDGPSADLVGMLTDPHSEDPVGSAEWAELKDVLVVAIDGLPDNEKTVITLYYAEELLLKEIAELMGVTESRVSQIHTRALYRLNRGLRSAIGAP